jgi:hypothetical protein
LQGIFLLNGLAQLPGQTIAIHWVAEITNAVCWLAFAASARATCYSLRTNLQTHDLSAARLMAPSKAK